MINNAVPRMNILMIRLAADAIVVVHLAFVLWVILGGLLVWRWPWLARLHLPAVAWGVFIEWSGGICPLTPWENALRQSAGASGYPGGFIDHYLLAILYPAGLTPELQGILGGAVILLNGIVYGAFLWHRQPWQ